MATKHRPEHHAPLRVESPMDYAQHEATYDLFIAGAKWGVILLAAILVILYFVIQP